MKSIMSMLADLQYDALYVKHFNNPEVGERMSAMLSEMQKLIIGGKPDEPPPAEQQPTSAARTIEG